MDAHAFAKHTDYTFHAYGRSEGVCGIIISDHQYPALVAHQLLSKVVDEFLSQNPRSSWASPGTTPQLVMPELRDYLSKYQDPRQADAIMRVQQELDETKIILVSSLSTQEPYSYSSGGVECIAQDYRVCTSARREDQ